MACAHNVSNEARCLLSTTAGATTNRCSQLAAAASRWPNFPAGTLLPDTGCVIGIETRQTAMRFPHPRQDPLRHLRRPPRIRATRTAMTMPPLGWATPPRCDPKWAGPGVAVPVPYPPEVSAQEIFDSSVGENGVARLVGQRYRRLTGVVPGGAVMAQRTPKTVVVSQEAVKKAAVRATKASAKLEGREVPADHRRSAAVEAYLAKHQSPKH